MGDGGEGVEKDGRDGVEMGDDVQDSSKYCATFRYQELGSDGGNAEGDVGLHHRVDRKVETMSDQRFREEVWEW